MMNFLIFSYKLDFSMWDMFCPDSQESVINEQNTSDSESDSDRHGWQKKLLTH